MPDDKISEEAAERSIQEFLDYYDLDLAVDVERKDIADRILAKLTRAVQKGRLEINPDGTMVQHLAYPPGQVTEVTYHEITGKAKLAAEKIAGEGNNTRRLYAFLGVISKIGINGISALKGPDMALAECIGSVFSWV